MLKTVTFRPSRIGCPSIPGTMKGIIISLPGVKDVKINYDERSADITFDSEKIKEEDISKKIGEEMGLAFEASPDIMHKKESPSDTCPM